MPSLTGTLICRLLPAPWQNGQLWMKLIGRFFTFSYALYILYFITLLAESILDT